MMGSHRCNDEEGLFVLVGITSLLLHYFTVTSLLHLFTMTLVLPTESVTASSHIPPYHKYCQHMAYPKAELTRARNIHRSNNAVWLGQNDWSDMGVSDSWKTGKLGAATGGRYVASVNGRECIWWTTHYNALFTLATGLTVTEITWQRMRAFTRSTVCAGFRLQHYYRPVPHVSWRQRDWRKAAEPRCCMRTFRRATVSMTGRSMCVWTVAQNL